MHVTLTKSRKENNKSRLISLAYWCSKLIGNQGLQIDTIAVAQEQRHFLETQFYGFWKKKCWNKQTKIPKYQAKMENIGGCNIIWSVNVWKTKISIHVYYVIDGCRYMMWNKGDASWHLCGLTHMVFIKLSQCITWSGGDSPRNLFCPPQEMFQNTSHFACLRLK